MSIRNNRIRSFVTFTKDEIKYIGENSKTMRPRELAEYFGCSQGAILYQINKNGFSRYSHYTSDVECAEEFMKMYNSTIGRDIIARKYGIKIDSVRRSAMNIEKKFGIKRINRNSKHEYRL